MSTVFPWQGRNFVTSLWHKARSGQSGRSLPRSTPLVIILVIGLAASLGAYNITKDLDQQSRKENFDRLAQEEIQEIQASVMSTAATLRSIRGLFNASGTVERDAFHAFVESLEVTDMVQALEWIPRVPHAVRPDYELTARRSGFADFEFTERASGGAMVRAGDREEYFPVYYVEPLAGNERVLGFDLGSNATRLAALDQARSSGRAVTTARITLVQETGEQYGFLIFIPVYRDGATPDTAEAREANLVGFGLGEFRMGDLVSSALSEGQRATKSIDFHIFDQSAAPGSRLLYPKSSLAQESGDVQAPLRRETMLRFATRDWLIVATPAEGSLFTEQSWAPWLTLMFGLVITALTAICFIVIIGRTRFADQLVMERTVELVRSNQRRDSVLEKLKQTNEDLESFAFVASHDLKAPLRGIDNLVTWIIEDPDSRLSKDSQHNARRLRTRVARLEALLDGLLEYSRAGKRQANVVPVDTLQLCEQIADYLAPPEGITISIAPDLPVFHTVKPALETVLRNLIGNALKHHDRDHGRIEVLADDQGDAYQFIVRDDGPGIDPAHHDRVFDVFQTLTPRSKLDSSGIGLSIVTRLVASAGGAIHIESDGKARGTAFNFTWKKTWPTEGDQHADSTG